MGLIKFFKSFWLFLKYRENLLKDNLTGFYSRILFKELVEREMERSKRYAHSLCLIFMDLDNLKSINDKTKDGHTEGDYALRRTAEIVQDESRTTDLLFRWGGDEFIVMMPEIKKEGPKRFIERVDKRLREASKNTKSKGYNLSITSSFLFWDKKAGLDLWIKEADYILKKKKEKKRSKR